MADGSITEWWCERRAYFIGEAMFHKDPEMKTLYQRYAALAATEMELNAAIEAAGRRKV